MNLVVQPVNKEQEHTGGAVMSLSTLGVMTLLEQHLCSLKSNKLNCDVRQTKFQTLCLLAQQRGGIFLFYMIISTFRISQRRALPVVEGS